jgi:hypothetical protein
LSTFSNPLTEYSPQLEFASETLPEFEEESGRSIFDESQELDLASGMLGVVNEEELDHFLGDVIHEAGVALGSDVKPSDARAIGHVLKKAIHQILPPTGTDKDALAGGSVGAQLGGGLSAMAGPMLGLELEGLSPEDREFEAARQFLRFAGQTVKQAVEGASSTDLHRVAHDMAHHAATEAAGVFAPGLLVNDRHINGRDSRDVPAESGRWISCHNRIILFGM